MSYKDKISNLIRNINYLMKHSLYDQREEDIVYLTNKILDDGIFEYGLEMDTNEYPNILSKKESIVKIKESGMSFVRLGDGEIALMQGKSHPFQTFNEEIRDILLNLLSGKEDKILVGLNKNYYISGQILPSNYNRRNAYDFRCFFNKYYDKNTTYIDGACTFFYPPSERSKEHDLFWETWKDLFKNKQIVIICGEGILDKLKYDVFEYAKEKEYIYGSKTNAWNDREKIREEIIKNVSKDKTLVFILGMAGKALIPELTNYGYQCWDIGHLAKSYDVYMSFADYDRQDFFAPD